MSGRERAVRAVVAECHASVSLQTFGFLSSAVVHIQRPSRCRRRRPHRRRTDRPSRSRAGTSRPTINGSVPHVHVSSRHEKPSPSYRCHQRRKSRRHQVSRAVVRPGPYGSSPFRCGSLAAVSRPDPVTANVPSLSSVSSSHPGQVVVVVGVRTGVARPSVSRCRRHVADQQRSVAGRQLQSFVTGRRSSEIAVHSSVANPVAVAGRRRPGPGRTVAVRRPVGRNSGRRRCRCNDRVPQIRVVQRVQGGEQVVVVVVVHAGVAQTVRSRQSASASSPISNGSVPHVSRRRCRRPWPRH